MNETSLPAETIPKVEIPQKEIAEAKSIVEKLYGNVNVNFSAQEQIKLYSKLLKKKIYLHCHWSDLDIDPQMIDQYFMTVVNKNIDLNSFEHKMLKRDLIMSACPHIYTIAETGSRVICSPPPTDTDEDYIVLTGKQLVTASNLKADGWTQDGQPEFYTNNDNGGFRSYRKGNINVITTQDTKFYNLFLAATYFAARLNLTIKADRIALFQLVLYGVTDYLEQRDDLKDRALPDFDPDINILIPEPD